MPIGPRSRAAAVEVAGDAQVDQPRRHAHHDVVRLHVEMGHALGAHVVQGRGDVERQRQQLLEGQGAAPLDQPPQGRALEVLDQQVRVRPVEHGAEAAHDHRMGEALERVGLQAKVAQGTLALGPVGAQDLGDDDRVQALVPDEQRLVAAAAAERLEHAAARGDLGALG